MDYSNNSSAKEADPDAESAEQDQDPRSNPTFWHKWVKDAWENKHAKRHRREAKAAWDEYLKTTGDDPSNKENDYERCDSIYWASCKTLEPAYYARKPKTVGRRRDGIDDAAARLAAKLAKQLGNFLVDSCEFDECFSKVVQEFIHADKATTQICYDADKILQRIEVAPDSVLPEGVSFEDLRQDPTTGGWYYEKEREINQKIYPKAVLSDEFLHTPTAKCWSEITEVAYKFCLSKEDALERFKDLDAQLVQWAKGKGAEDEERDRDDQGGEFLEGWECYCFKTKKIYWISACYAGKFLDQKPDLWELRNFLPSPRAIIGSSPARHLYPTPSFVQLSKTIKQRHICYAKIFELIKAIRRRALVDGSSPELLKAFEELGDNEFIVVEDFQRLVEKVSSVQNLIWYLPVAELVAAVQELVQLDQFFGQKFDIAFGVPEILRGVSDPTSTATADGIAAGAAHDRFKYQKAQVQKLASDTIEMMVDLALKMFDQEKLDRIWQPSKLSPTDQQYYGEAVQILTNDEERTIRIEVETDSMSFVNDQQESQRRNAVVQTVVGGIKEIGVMLGQGAPEFAAVAMHTVVHALDGLRGGEDFIEEIKTQTQKLLEKATQPPPQAPPPPDYEAMKLELMQFKAQSDAAAKNRELDQKEFKLELEAQKQAGDQAYQQLSGQLDQAMVAIEQLRSQLDVRKLELAETEMVAEETRLRAEAEANLANPPERQEPAGPAASITIVNAPQPTPPIIPVL